MLGCNLRSIVHGDSRVVVYTRVYFEPLQTSYASHACDKSSMPSLPFPHTFSLLAEGESSSLLTDLFPYKIMWICEFIEASSLPSQNKSGKRSSLKNPSNVASSN